VRPVSRAPGGHVRQALDGGAGGLDLSWICGVAGFNASCGMDLRLKARVLVCYYDLMVQLGGGEIPAPLFPPSPPSQPLTIRFLRRCQCIGG
jgi:hypothetical protein